MHNHVMRAVGESEAADAAKRNALYRFEDAVELPPARQDAPKR